jgi:N-acetylmuramic acid 6-phosphate etherase
VSETLHPRADELDGLSTLEFLELMHAEDAAAVASMRRSLGDIARAVEEIAERLRSGGRLHYFGVGSSGLIAKLDAAECPATFGIATDVVQAHYADDPQEDDSDLGRQAAGAVALGPQDVAVGLSASGRSAYVLGALEHARENGALRVAITSHPGSPAARLADIAIEVASGPEVIAGSTRLKAGTVQKLALNMLSTAVFTRLGCTHRGRMVGVVASNEKLRARAARIVAELGGVSLDEARRRLEESGGDVRAAIAGRPGA